MYGRDPQSDLRITDSACSHFECRFSLSHGGRDLGEFQLQVPGFHNVLDATAAVAVGLELEVKLPVIREALAGYTGVDRRFQVRGQARGVTVIDDYGHHPTEIRATLAAARQCDYGRIHAIFQPHRYTRTLHLMDDFAKSFHQADSVYLMDIYAASEASIDGVSSQALAERIRDFGHRSVEYTGDAAATVDKVLGNAAEGDLALTLGAGNVWQVGERLLERLREGA
jgi:UDP-N-acetylmuramate--alanine ligase